MEIVRETIGPLTVAMRVRLTAMSHRSAPNHYLVSAHDALPMLVGIRYLGQDRGVAEAVFKLSVNRDRSLIQECENAG